MTYRLVDLTQITDIILWVMRHIEAGADMTMARPLKEICVTVPTPLILDFSNQFGQWAQPVIDIQCSST